jgi:MFS family permease
MAVFDAVLPLFVHRTFHWNSDGAGLMFLAITIPTFLSPLVGWLADKHGPRWYVVAGYALATIPLVLLRLITENTLHDKILLCALLALSSGFANCSEIPLELDIILATEERMKERPEQFGEKGAYAQAFGLGNLMFALGMVIGPFWGGFLNETHGWGALTLSLGVMVGASTIPAVLWTGGSIFKRRKTQLAQGTAPALECIEEQGGVTIPGDVR